MRVRVGVGVGVRVRKVGVKTRGRDQLDTQTVDVLLAESDVEESYVAVEGLRGRGRG